MPPKCFYLVWTRDICAILIIPDYNHSLMVLIWSRVKATKLYLHSYLGMSSTFPPILPIPHSLMVLIWSRVKATKLYLHSYLGMSSTFPPILPIPRQYHCCNSNFNYVETTVRTLQNYIYNYFIFIIIIIIFFFFW